MKLIDGQHGSFLEHLLKAKPYRNHTTLNGNGIQLPEQPRNPQHRLVASDDFRRNLRSNNIEHRLTRLTQLPASLFISRQREIASVKTSVTRIQIGQTGVDAEDRKLYNRR